MMGDEGSYSRMSAWIRGKSQGMYVRPRLFMPYYDEAKVGVYIGMKIFIDHVDGLVQDCSN